MATINYADKVAINVNPNIPEINKVTDGNMNLIKQVGNQILTTMGVYTDDWNSATTYAIGEIAIYDNRIFKNLTGTNTATTPVEDTTNWLEVSIRDISGGAEIPIQDTAPANPREDDLWIDTSEEGFDNSNVVNQYSDSTTDVYSCNYVNGKVSAIPKNTCIVSKSGITSATLTSSNGYGRVWVLSGVSLTIVSFNGDGVAPTITDAWGTHSFTASVSGKVITLSSLANWDHYIFMGTDVITSIE